MLELLRRYPRQLAYGFLHCFASSIGQTFFISLFVAGVTARMDWGAGTFAWVYSGLTLASAFALPLVGTRIDRLRVRTVSVATALVVAAACVAVAYAAHPVVLVAAFFLVRLGGQGTFPLIASTVTGRYFTARRGKALSVAILGIPTAEIIIPVAAVWVLAVYGFTTTWLLGGAALALGFIPAVVWLVDRDDPFQTAGATAASAGTRDGVDPTPAEEVRSWRRGEVLRDPHFLLVLPLLVFTPFLMTGVIFNQSIVSARYGFAPTVMALAISTYGLARMACILVAGGVTDRLGAERLPRVAFFPVLLGLALLYWAPGALSVRVFFGLAGVTAGIESVVWPALWSQRYGPRYLGSIKSSLRVIVVVCTAIAPVVFSVGLRWSVPSTVALAAGYCAAAIALANVQRAWVTSRR